MDRASRSRRSGHVAHVALCFGIPCSMLLELGEFLCRSGSALGFGHASTRDGLKESKILSAEGQKSKLLDGQTLRNSSMSGLAGVTWLLENMFHIFA